MNVFNLPDLGEGLPDAEIVKWHVSEGDRVEHDQILVSMETAKAIVDVPSPVDATIEKLFGKPGDIINTGEPLIGFSGADKSETESVSVIETAFMDSKSLKSQYQSNHHTQKSEIRIKAMPSVRALAHKLDVDLKKVIPTGIKNRIMIKDVEAAAKGGQPGLQSSEALRGVRRAMANAMMDSHAHVVPVTLVDDADIDLWSGETDITWRVLRATVVACQKVPALNAHFDMASLTRTLFHDIHVGIAMNSNEGLFVPVFRKAQKYSQVSFRHELEKIKGDLKNRAIPADKLTGSTIQISNFGTFAGRYANPIVVPPNVAIIGTGKIREEVVAIEKMMAIRKILPLSITIDHRAVTGAEVALFLKAMMDDLRLAT